MSLTKAADQINWMLVLFLVMMTTGVAALAMTAGLRDAPAWWQAILSGFAVLASLLIWRIDRAQDRRERAERDQKDYEAQEAEGRSAAIQILDDVLTLDAWVRGLQRLRAEPGTHVRVGGALVPIVRTAPPLQALRDATPVLHRVGPGSINLQRALFRYRQLVKVLEEAHDPLARVQAAAGMTREAFREALGLIANDLDLYMPAMFQAMWGVEAAPDALIRGRAARQDAGLAAGPAGPNA